MINLLIIILLYFNNCNENEFFINKLHNDKNKNNNNFSQSYNLSQIYSKKKNLILGLIQKYSLKKILPFFNSFLKANFENCDIVMFIRYISPNIINYLKSIGVIVFKIPNKYKKVSAINVRWKMYLDFLKDKKNIYNLVLHTDVRDSIFQKDIFKYYEDYQSFLGVSIEDGTLNEKLNKNWIIKYVGEEKYRKIKNERIICVGQIWGTIDKFLEFSSILWLKLKANPKAIEQGICNYLIYYEKKFKDYLVKSDNFGPIMTIGLTDLNNIHFDSEKNILNFKNETASIIHQYDRKKYIQNIVFHKFCPELFILNQSNKFNFSYTNKFSINKKKDNIYITRNFIFWLLI